MAARGVMRRAWIRVDSVTQGLDMDIRELTADWGRLQEEEI